MCLSESQSEASSIRAKVVSLLIPTRTSVPVCVAVDSRDHLQPGEALDLIAQVGEPTAVANARLEGRRREEREEGEMKLLRFENQWGFVQ